MNYDLIKILCTRRGVSMNKLSHEIGFSEPGFYRMIKEKTIKVEVLEKIAAALFVDPGVFFKEPGTAEKIAAEPLKDYEIKKTGAAEPSSNLLEIIALQRFKIQTLEAELEALKKQ